jgi:hypothetical protein
MFLLRSDKSRATSHTHRSFAAPPACAMAAPLEAAL